MILKNNELHKLKSIKSNIYLLYGENEGYKLETINNFFVDNFKGSINKYDESEIIDKFDDIISSILNKSFFDNEKVIIISRVTDKIINFLDKLKNKNIENVKIIISAGSLDKKSKLRSYFEKDNDIICIAFYSDDSKTLSYLTYNFFKSKNISLSQENINLIIERARGDRNNLYKELQKIDIYLNNNNKITLDEIIKLTNLANNYSISELADNCLSKNLKKTISILNENNFSSEDYIILLRTLLLKTKRLLKLKKNHELEKDINKIITNFKPQIFWKEKDIVKKQIVNWTKNETENLIYEINDLELLVKKNSLSSLNLISDFILSTSKNTSN